MLPLADRRLRLTEAEFLALPETSDHVELVDGEVVIMPGPSLLHQEILFALVYALQGWARAHPPARAIGAPLDVRMGSGRILQPDAMLWRDGVDADDAPIATVPTLCVEVLSKNGTYDRIAKRLLYAEAGVAEYWIVDPMTRSVEVVRGLETVASVTGSLRSAELPGFTLDLSTIFRAD